MCSSNQEFSNEVSDAPADRARKDRNVVLRFVTPRAGTNAIPRPNTDRTRKDRNVVLRFGASCLRKKFNRRSWRRTQRGDDFSVSLTTVLSFVFSLMITVGRQFASCFGFEQPRILRFVPAAVCAQKVVAFFSQGC